MRRGYWVAVLLPLVLAGGCRSENDENLRDAYERMMATAERPAEPEPGPPPAAVDTPTAAQESVPPPEALPMDTLPRAAPADTVAPAEAEPPAFEGTVEPEQRQRAGMGASTLRGVRTAGHPGFDRVVFEFDGATPGYHVEYVDRPIRECGSGRVVQVAGQGWLRVRLEPARAHELVDGFAQVTVASRNRSLDHTLLRQIVLTCDFEGQVEWVAGVRSPNSYRLLQLTEPARLVVDINH